VRSLRSWKIRHGAPPTGVVDSIGEIQHGFWDYRSGPRVPYAA